MADIHGFSKENVTSCVSGYICLLCLVPDPQKLFLYISLNQCFVVLGFFGSFLTRHSLCQCLFNFCYRLQSQVFPYCVKQTIIGLNNLLQMHKMAKNVTLQSQKIFLNLNISVFSNSCKVKVLTSWNILVVLHLFLCYCIFWGLHIYSHDNPEFSNQCHSIQVFLLILVTKYLSLTLLLHHFCSAFLLLYKSLHQHKIILLIYLNQINFYVLSCATFLFIADK